MKKELIHARIDNELEILICKRDYKKVRGLFESLLLDSRLNLEIYSCLNISIIP